MPELPEVETVARQLAPLVEGQRVTRVEIFDTEKIAWPNPGLVEGRTICRVTRLGKQIVISLAGKRQMVQSKTIDYDTDYDSDKDRDRDAERKEYASLYLCVHLRMTGRLMYVAESFADGARPRPLRARLTLDRGFIHFSDTRRFGTFRLLDCLEAIEPLGLDPVGAAFSVAALRERLKGSPQELKPWLLRQDRLVGIGNIYASEILWRAHLTPRRAAGSLTLKEIERLHEATVAVLRQAIECGGTTIDDYRNAWGAEGGYQKRLTVYDLAGEPCPRCGGIIERLVQQGRSTYYCPKCQK